MLHQQVLKEGKTPPIVFLHGFLGTSEDWTDLIRFLPTDHLCIGIDLPGHGNSPLEELVIPYKAFHLVGYSMGGRLACRLTNALSTTLLSTHPGLVTEEERQKRFEQDLLWAEKLQTLPIDQFLKSWYDQPIFKPFVPNLSRRMQHDPKQLAKALLFYSTAKEPYRDLRGVLVGVRDTKFRALLKEPILIPNAGHMIHLENPKRCAEIIAQNIKRSP